MARSGKSNLFEGLQKQEPDALLALIEMVRKDRRSEKIDLGVGVYQDDSGASPVFLAVKAAERALVDQQTSKAYLGAAGDPHFSRLNMEIALGSSSLRDERIVGIQTPGGCGALRLGAELIKQSDGSARVFLGYPTWANHVALLDRVGLERVEYTYLDHPTQRADISRIVDALSAARPGDVLLIQGCCHNPTGVDLSRSDWATLAEIVHRRGLVPFVDLAYQGLGEGMEEDAYGTRTVVEAADQALVAYSNDKSFGLYRERAGSLFVKANDGKMAATVSSSLQALARTNWSMPPDHGAAVVRTILGNSALREAWASELSAMRDRIISLRSLLSDVSEQFSYLRRQNGMFSVIPFSLKAIQDLRAHSAIYIADSGRVNISGLNHKNIARFADIVSRVLRSGGNHILH